jgi:hypothetical protein
MSQESNKRQVIVFFRQKNLKRELGSNMFVQHWTDMGLKLAYDSLISIMLWIKKFWRKYFRETHSIFRVPIPVGPIFDFVKGDETGLCHNHRIRKRKPVKWLLSRLTQILLVLITQNSSLGDRKEMHNRHQTKRVESGAFLWSPYDPTM